jgi:hypothetical protein
MLVLPAAVTQRTLIGTNTAATDAVALLLMGGGMAALGWLLWRELRAWSAERTASSGVAQPASANS